MKRIIAIQENCISCGLCEVYSTVASMTLVNCIERAGSLYNLMKNKVNLKCPRKTCCGTILTWQFYLLVFKEKCV